MHPPSRVGWLHSITPLGVHPLPHLTNVFTSWQHPVHATTHKRICSSLLLNLNSFDCITYQQFILFRKALYQYRKGFIFKLLSVGMGRSAPSIFFSVIFALAISNANEMLKKIGIKLLFESYYLCIFSPQMYVFKPTNSSFLISWVLKLI